MAVRNSAEVPEKTQLTLLVPFTTFTFPCRVSVLALFPLLSQELHVLVDGEHAKIKPILFYTKGLFAVPRESRRPAMASIYCQRWRSRDQLWEFATYNFTRLNVLAESEDSD